MWQIGKMSFTFEEYISLPTQLHGFITRITQTCSSVLCLKQTTEGEGADGASQTNVWYKLKRLYPLSYPVKVRNPTKATIQGSTVYSRGEQNAGGESEQGFFIHASLSARLKTSAASARPFQTLSTHFKINSHFKVEVRPLHLQDDFNLDNSMLKYHPVCKHT